MGAMTTVLTSEPYARRRSVVPEGWLRAIVAALEAVLLGWIVCVVPAIAAYVATAAAPALGQTEWPAALGMGSAGWLLGHGAPAGQLSIVPLGLSAVFAAVLMFPLRRHRLPGPSLGIGAVAYVGLVQLVALLSPYAVSRGELFLGSLALAAAGAGWAWWRSGVRTSELIAADVSTDGPTTAEQARRRLVMVGVRALRGAFAMLLLVTVVGLLATLAAIGLHWDRVSALFTSYDAGLIGGTVLVLAHLAYLPTAGVWSLAYLAGPGFAVGTGTSVAPAGVELGAVPAIPMLGALPEDASPLAGWATAGFVVLGVIAALWGARPGQSRRLLDALAAVLGAAIATGVVLAVAGAAAAGSIGEGRMAVLGPDALPFAAIIAGLLALGGIVGTVAVHPATRAGIGSGIQRVREQRESSRGGGASAGSGRSSGSASSARSAASASGARSASGATGASAASMSSAGSGASAASPRSGASAASPTASSGEDTDPDADSARRSGSLAPAPRRGSSWRRRWESSAGASSSRTPGGDPEDGDLREDLEDTAPRPSGWSASGTMSSPSASSS